MGTAEKMSELRPSKELESLMDFVMGEISKELPTLTVDINYFLLGVLAHKDNDLYRRLNSCMTTNALQSMYNTWYQVVSSRAIAAVKPNRVPNLDSKMVELMRAAGDEASKLESEEVTTEHVMLAILADNDDTNKVKKVFNKAGITYGILLNKMKEGKPMSTDSIQTVKLPNGGEINLIEAGSKEEAMAKLINMSKSNGLGDIPGVSNKRKGKNEYINEYCTDLNALVFKQKIDPIVGRDREMSEIIRILGRKKKNNVILLGGEGVGKTAIGEALAWKIVNDEVPDFLSDKVLVSLDMTALMAGTTLRGMFEERVKGILDDVKADGHFIVFIDNIGAVLADKGKNDFELASMLSRSLENGEIQVIGTSDFASYRKTFDKDPSLARRFQKIIVEASSEEESEEILKGLKESYETHHKVKYSDEAISACVKLAGRYMTERNLPDSAIDIMDEAGAVVGTLCESEELVNLKKKGHELMMKELRAKREKGVEFTEEDKKLLSEINGRYKTAREKFVKEREENPPVITKETILDVVSTKTGIPVNNLTSDDKKKLASIDDRLREGVVGQDEAITTICRALKRNRVGIHKGGCMYSAIEIGKTGVGKTLIAKKLAKELFGSEKALVRFDMSEYSDKVSVNKLIGSNPGYVGYEEGGQLTETIKNKKHCVLLLDEIEKADPEVYNIFLQVLDEGFLTDNSGMKVDFSNVIVLFTSNVGAKAASDFGKGIGFTENEDANAKKILLKQLKNRFPPEFLNRIDDVIYFNSLTDENLKEIIRIEMGKLGENIKAIGYEMSYDDDIVDYVFNIVKDEKEFGARPIMRAIQDNIEDKITDAILENDFKNGHIFKISCVNDKSEVVIA